MVQGPEAGLERLKALDADPRLAQAASRTSSLPEPDYLLMMAARLDAMPWRSAGSRLR